MDRLDKIEKIFDLYERGILSLDEYEKQKARLLKNSSFEIISEKVALASRNVAHSIEVARLSDVDRGAVSSENFAKANRVFSWFIIVAAIALISLFLLLVA